MVRWTHRSAAIWSCGPSAPDSGGAALPGGQFLGPVEHVGAVLAAGVVVVDVVADPGQVVGGDVRRRGERRGEFVDFRRAGVPQLFVLTESEVDRYLDGCGNGREVDDPAADDLQQFGDWDR